MATLREAERARDETAEELRRLGAHAISVEEETDALDAELGTVAAEPVGGSTGPTQAGEPGVGPAEPTQADGVPPTGEDTGAGAGPGTGTGDVQGSRKRRSFAVVAWFEGDPPVDLPRDLEIQAGTTTKAVPLRARRTEQFRAE